MATDRRLSDGSICRVEHQGERQSIISRVVGGEVVWGQVFSEYPKAHRAQVKRVVDSMKRDPAAFDRRAIYGSASS